MSDKIEETAVKIQMAGFCRTVALRLAKRGAIVIDGVVYAPVAKRKR